MTYQMNLFSLSLCPSTATADFIHIGYTLNFLAKIFKGC